MLVNELGSYTNFIPITKSDDKNEDLGDTKLKYIVVKMRFLVRVDDILQGRPFY